MVGLNASDLMISASWSGLVMNLSLANKEKQSRNSTKISAKSQQS